jgi:hypothetical protein
MKQNEINPFRSDPSDDISLTEDQYNEVKSQIIYKGDQNEHWTFQKHPIIDSTRYSPAAMGKLLYKYHHPDSHIYGLKWRRLKDKCNYTFGMCFNPDHIEYMPEDELKKIERQYEKDKKTKEKAEGWRRCTLCNIKFIEAQQFLNDKNHYCSKLCLLYEHGYNKERLWGNKTIKDYTAQCWKNHNIRDSVICSAYGGFTEDSLYNIAVKARIELDCFNIFDPNNSEHIDFRCPYNENCINPYHYRVITRTEIDEEKHRLREAENKAIERQRIKAEEQQERRERHKLQNDIIEAIPECFEEGFRRWYRNHLFANLADCLLHNKKDQAYAIVEKLKELQYANDDDNDETDKVDFMSAKNPRFKKLYDTK